MLSCDELAMAVSRERPDWLAAAFQRLDGYPDERSCWSWAGCTSSGYGRLLFPRSLVNPQRGIGVHRLVWLTLVGPIQPGFVLDHHGPNGCGNQACANPAHLTAVTRRHNLVMTGAGICADESRRTHCPAGHPLTDGNLRPSQMKRGLRACLTCSRENARTRGHLISQAASALGLTQHDYTRQFGWSAATASVQIEAAVRGEQ